MVRFFGVRCIFLIFGDIYILWPLLGQHPSIIWLIALVFSGPSDLIPVGVSFSYFLCFLVNRPLDMALGDTIFADLRSCTVRVFAV